MKRKTGRIVLITLLILGTAFIALGLDGRMEITQVTLELENLDRHLSGLKIAHVTDLHGKMFGENQQELVEAIRQEEPDIIAITGDMITTERPDEERAILALVEGLNGVAPIYFVSGNHEMRDLNNYRNLVKKLEAAGATCLDNGKASHQGLTLLGLEDPPRYQDVAWLKENAEGATVLLSHRPEFTEVYEASGVSVVLSGHAHGGQIRLPLIGALYAPGQGVFPKYAQGVHELGATYLVVSRGLGTGRVFMRLYNKPELIILTLTSAQAEGMGIAAS